MNETPTSSAPYNLRMKALYFVSSIIFALLACAGAVYEPMSGYASALPGVAMAIVSAGFAIASGLQK